MASGRGVVAIVQGSKHAGLTVTMLPDRRRCCRRQYMVLDVGMKNTRCCKSNVETNTEWISKLSNIPVWDVRYDSGYQFANCLRSPSYQQRSGSLGNGSGEIGQFSTGGIRPDGLMYRTRTKGSCSHPLQHTASFVRSLRHYPRAASSAELVQRILDYTCTRHHTKKPSRSIRSLLRKSTSQQTHRIGRKKENAASHKIKTSCGKLLDRSASTVGKRCSSQDELLDYTYDYLNSSSFNRGRADVRYLTEMKRVLRDRLREIVDNKPTMCPNMQHRYNIHKKQDCTRHNKLPVRLSTESKAVPNVAHENSYTAPKHSLQKVCFCQSATPCVCQKSHDANLSKEIKEWLNNIPVYPNFSEDDKKKQDQMLEELTNTMKELLKESHFNLEAKKEILRFLKALPMWHPSDSNEDAMFKEKLANNLIERLGKTGEAMFEQEIAKGTNKLPLDLENINREDMNNMKQKFANRLKSIAVNPPPDEEEHKKALKPELLDLLEDVPIKYESQKPKMKLEAADEFPNKLHHIKLPTSKQTAANLKEDKIEKKFIDIRKDIPELSSLKASDQKELTQFLKTKLKEYDPKDFENSEVQQKLQKEIKEWLNNAVVSEYMDLKTKNKLTKKIIQQLRTDRNRTDKKTNNVEQKVMNLTKNIPELSDLNAAEQKELTECLKNIMSEYDSEDFEDTEIQQKMLEEIREWIDNAAISGRINSKTKDKLVKNIIQELRIDHTKINYEDTLGLIEKWVHGIPELSEGDRINIKLNLQDLATQVDEILTSGEDSEDIQVDIREIITDWLQNMLRQNSRRLSLTIQENLVNELVKKINYAPKQRRHMQSEGQNMYKDVAAWMKNIPGIDSNIDLDQSSAIEDLMITLNDIKNNINEVLVEQQAREAIKRFIENISGNMGVTIDPKQRKLLEHKLMRQMEQAPQQRKRWNKENGFGSSTPYTSGRDSPSPDLSLIRNVSVLEEHSEIEEYMKILNNLIENWIKSLELNIGSAEQRNLVADIASDVVDRLKYLKLSNIKTSEADELEHLKYQIFRRLNKLNIEDLPRIITRVNDLYAALLSNKVPDLTKISNRAHFTRNVDNLLNSLKTWLENISTDVARSYNKPYSDDVFIDLAKNLADLKDSINHYHMKNEILQWLPKLFTNLNANELNNLADSLKNHLMNDLAQSMAQDVSAGLVYRQTLWDTLSKTLPSIHMTSADDLHAFDLLKERLVDAFINLHYFAGDMIALDKFRTKLNNEVNKFCNEYLRRYPELPVNSEEISKNLYNALRNVSVPNIETVRSDLEQVRLKEEILDWLPYVPLDKSKSMEPQINAMVSGLAKRLHGLEKEKDRNPNKDNEMKNEIMKWLDELPLRNKEQINLQDFADKLMDKLRSTDKSRTLSVSKIGKYGDNIISTQEPSQYPQSNLGVEDRAHLERIRRRSDYSRANRTKCICRDASVSPPPVESGVQTDINGRIEGAAQTRPSLYDSNMIHREVSPQVIIKEYYWNSTSSNVSLREGRIEPSRAYPPCSSCKITETETSPQVVRISSRRTKEAQTEAINNTHPKTQADKICDKRQCSLGTLADRNSCLRPPCFISEERQEEERRLGTLADRKSYLRKPCFISEEIQEEERWLETLADRKSCLRTPCFISEERQEEERRLETLADRKSCLRTPCFISEERQEEERRLETLADRKSNLRPPFYFPKERQEEERRTYQRIDLPSENIGPRRSKVYNCCNCGQRIHKKCRGRHNGYRTHCNSTCLKYCVNCASGCPYPSNLYFKKEFR